MTLSKIKKAIEKAKELPTLPVVANKVNALLYNPKSNVSDLAKIIDRDQSLTAKVLRLVNSAYYNLPQKITNITQAVTLLGYKNVSHIVMTLSVFKTIKEIGAGTFNRKDFWIHSIATATMSVNVAKICMYKNYEDVFTAGLLHDIGKVFMDGFLHEEFIEIINKSNDHHISFSDAEHRLFDVDHAMIGEWIARTWRLPLDTVAAIKYHHQDVEKRKGLSNSNEIFIDFIRIADVAVRIEKYGNNGDGLGYSPELSLDLFKRLPIFENDVYRLLKDLNGEIKKSETLLNFAV